MHCCGPESMLAEAEAVFPAGRPHVERFRLRTRTFAPNTAFEAVCARSGKTVPVEAGDSLLDSLRFAGVPVASGCREGVCGSCELRYLDGEPEHRDDIGPPRAAPTRACPAPAPTASCWTPDRRRVQSSRGGPRTEQLAELAGLVDSGALENGRVRGGLVIRV